MGGISSLTKSDYNLYFKICINYHKLFPQNFWYPEIEKHGYVLNYYKNASKQDINTA